MSKWMKILCFINKLAYFIWPTFLKRQFSFIGKIAIIEQLKYDFTIRWEEIKNIKNIYFQ